MSLTRLKLPYLSKHKGPNGYSIDYFGWEHFTHLNNNDGLWFFKHDPITKVWIHYLENIYGTLKIRDRDLIRLNIMRGELIIRETLLQFIMFKLFLLQDYGEVGNDLYVHFGKFI